MLTAEAEQHFVCAGLVSECLSGEENRPESQQR